MKKKLISALLIGVMSMSATARKQKVQTRNFPWQTQKM